MLWCGCEGPATGHDGGDGTDGYEDGWTDGDGEEGTDASDDGGDQVPPFCAPGAGLPAWVEQADRVFTAHCPNADLLVSFPEEGILRLHYLASGASPPGRPSYAVVGAEDPSTELSYGSHRDRFYACTPVLRLEVESSACRVSVVDVRGDVLLEDPLLGGYFEESGDVGVVRWAVAGEHFYGLGEKTGPLDRRGRVLVMRNTDPYDAALGGYPPDADPLYQSIPFFIGLRGGTAYGVFVDNTYQSEFDLAASDPDTYRITAAGGTFDQYLLAGPSMAGVLERYTRLTGRMPLPPRWTLGYHQSRWGYYPDTRVGEVCTGFRDREIPADGIWLDIQHLDGFRSWTWDPAGFADPSGLVAGLEASGFKTTVIVDPGIKVDDAWDVYQSGLAAGCYLEDAAGDPYVGEVWPGPAVFPDFTAERTRSWWAGLVPRVTGHGVRGIWLDMNEPTSFLAAEGNTVPDHIACDGDGFAATMAEAHNIYALAEARATYEGMLAAQPGRRPFLLTRAGFAGIQRSAATWTGDAPSTFATLQTTLPMLLGLGLSGLTFSGSDVGGYSGQASGELFARWMQVGSISPFFRGHTMQDGNDQEPWMFGPEVEDISRAAIRERYRLLPTLYSLFDSAARTGAPVLRPLVFEFQEDPGSATVGDQAMLGPWILFAPVLQEGAARRSVYLPPGRWFELHSGAVSDGPATLPVDVTLAALPAYVREGAIILRGPDMQWSDQLPVDPLYLDIYPAQTETSFTHYEDAGDSLDYLNGDYCRTTYRLIRSADQAVLSADPRQGGFQPPDRTLVVRLHRADRGASGVRLSGQDLPEFASYEELLASGNGWWHDRRDLAVVAAFADRPDLVLEFSYDPAISDPAPPVEVRFRVTVPPGTPADPPVHIATSANGWAHLPLAWIDSETAEGLVELPRGEWFFYKYTRGSWETVEKWPGCAEAENRYGFAAAHPVRQDRVETWADWCP